MFITNLQLKSSKMIIKDYLKKIKNRYFNCLNYKF